MIIYTIKTSECMQALSRCVSKNKAMFWMSSTISIDKINIVLPKLIEKYNLWDTTNERSLKRKQGLPVWDLVFNYNASEPNYLTFWLFTTGYKESAHLAKKNIDQLNKQLRNDENLKPVISNNPNDLIVFREYIMGQYIKYHDLRDKISRFYINPSEYGMPIQPEILNGYTDLNLSINSIYDSENKINIGINLNEKENNKYDENLNRYGSFYLKDIKKDQSFTREEILSTLKKGFGVIGDESKTYQELYSLLMKYLNRNNNHLMHIFKTKSKKSVVCTWYFNDAYLERLQSEISYRFKHIAKRPELFEEMITRLHRRGNFHGVRHQIGVITSKIKSVIKVRYPLIYNGLDINRDLHYVRFGKNSYNTFNEYHLGCIAASIIFEKRKIIKELEKTKLRKVRIKLRASNPKLANANIIMLNALIKEVDRQNNSYVNKIEITEQDIQDFLERNQKMNSVYISKTL